MTASGSACPICLDADDVELKRGMVVAEGPDAARRFDVTMEQLLRVSKEKLARGEPAQQEARKDEPHSRAKANRVKITAEGFDVDVAVFGHGRPITSDAGRAFRELRAQA
jgi:hypothetical protein